MSVSGGQGGQGPVGCVDFMSEYGQPFNGNRYVFSAEKRRDLEGLLDRLIAAARTKSDEALLPLLKPDA